MKNVTIPGEPVPARSPVLRGLTVAASALTASSILVNLILQAADFSKKRPVEADQRDRLTTASFVLSVLRQLPGLIRQVRLLVDQARSS